MSIAKDIDIISTICRQADNVFEPHTYESKLRVSLAIPIIDWSEVTITKTQLIQLRNFLQKRSVEDSLECRALNPLSNGLSHFRIFYTDVKKPKSFDLGLV